MSALDSFFAHAQAAPDSADWFASDALGMLASPPPKVAAAPQVKVPDDMFVLAAPPPLSMAFPSSSSLDPTLFVDSPDTYERGSPDSNDDSNDDTAGSSSSPSPAAPPSAAGAVARPLTPHSRSPSLSLSLSLAEDDDQKRQKLAHKAELARQNRKRKKMRMCDLEERVSALQDELEREKKRRICVEESLTEAKSRLMSAAAAAAAAPSLPAPAAVAAATAAAAEPQPMTDVPSEEHLADETRRIHEAMAELSRPGAVSSPERARELVQALLDTFRRRSQKNRDALTALRTSVVPALPLRFLEWVLMQQDRFYEDENGLWSSLFKQEVGLTAEQMVKVLALREVSRPVMPMPSLLSSDSISHCLEAQLTRAHLRMREFVSILTPEQLARFFVWVNRFGSVCVQIHV